MFTKILVANRGEIAIRALRAANELGARTVAVFPWDDRNSVHRQKADEAYEIGEKGHPVRAYLDPAEIVRVAVESGAEAIFPPGPNGPVGIVWMGINKEHYGIHGTPEPGHISRTQSSGCVRLTNFADEAVSSAVKIGTPVTFQE